MNSGIDADEYTGERPAAGYALDSALGGRADEGGRPGGDPGPLEDPALAATAEDARRLAAACPVTETQAQVVLLRARRGLDLRQVASVVDVPSPAVVELYTDACAAIVDTLEAAAVIDDLDLDCEAVDGASNRPVGVLERVSAIVDDGAAARLEAGEACLRVASGATERWYWLQDGDIREWYREHRNLETGCDGGYEHECGVDADHLRDVLDQHDAAHVTVIDRDASPYWSGRPDA